VLLTSHGDDLVSTSPPPPPPPRHAAAVESHDARRRPSTAPSASCGRANSGAAACRDGTRPGISHGGGRCAYWVSRWWCRAGGSAAAAAWNGR